MNIESLDVLDVLGDNHLIIIMAADDAVDLVEFRYFMRADSALADNKLVESGFGWVFANTHRLDESVGFN